jgi:hypothetical protein
MGANSQAMPHQERLNRYETAQETIGLMMAMFTEQIQSEEQKSEPNSDTLQRLNAEFDRLDAELYGLKMSDDEAIQRVLDLYGPILKADLAQSRLAA